MEPIWLNGVPRGKMETRGFFVHFRGSMDVGDEHRRVIVTCHCGPDTHLLRVTEVNDVGPFDDADRTETETDGRKADE